MNEKVKEQQSIRFPLTRYSQLMWTIGTAALGSVVGVLIWHWIQVLTRKLLNYLFYVQMYRYQASFWPANMSDSILVDVDLEPAKSSATFASSSMKQKVDLQNCDNSREGKFLLFYVA